MSIIYRTATIGDAGELKRLNDEFNGNDCNTVEGIIEALKRDDAETVFVAEHNNKLLGFCCGQLFKSICYDAFYVEITELYVNEAFRKQAIGKNLVNYAEEWYRKQGVHNFQLFRGQDNEIAREFYEHIGYCKQNDILYRKRDTKSVP